jgi:hypothetical protein
MNKQDMMTAGDEGGPTRAFLSEVWGQMRDLDVKHNGRAVKLFTENCLPNENCNITSKLNLSYDQEMARQLVRPYYMALGRLMLYTIAMSNRQSFCDKRKKTEIFMAPHVLPRIYRYYLLKDIDPMNEQYPLVDLLHHVIEMREHVKGQSYDKTMESYFSAVDIDGDVSNDVYSNFRQAAQEDFIDRRSWALDAMKEGITLDGKLSNRNKRSTLPSSSCVT